MNAIASKAMHMPGGSTQNQYSLNPFVTAMPDLANSLSSLPQVITMGSNNPRKLKDASAVIAAGTEVAKAR